MRLFLITTHLVEEKDPVASQKKKSDAFNDSPFNASVPPPPKLETRNCSLLPNPSPLVPSLSLGRVLQVSACVRTTASVDLIVPHIVLEKHPIKQSRSYTLRSTPPHPVPTHTLPPLARRQNCIDKRKRQQTSMKYEEPQFLVALQGSLPCLRFCHNTAHIYKGKKKREREIHGTGDTPLSKNIRPFARTQQSCTKYSSISLSTHTRSL